MQGPSPSLTSAAGAMRVFSPRPRNSIAQTFCISWQTFTHLPQRTHLSGLRMREPVEVSIGRFLIFFGKGCSRMPNSAARRWSSHSWLRGQARQSSGWVERMSSMTVFLVATSSASLVTMSMPSSRGVQQARISLGLLPFLTTQMPQAAQGSRSSLTQSVGILTSTLRAASRIVVPSATWTGMPFIFALTISLDSLVLDDGAEFACLEALAALDALGLIDDVGLLRLPRDAGHGAPARAEMAADALDRIDRVDDEVLALARAAFAVPYVLEVLLAEMPDGG